MSPHAAHYQDALAALDLHLGWDSRWMPLIQERDGEERVFYLDAHAKGSADRLRRLVDAVERDHSDTLSLGLPERKRFAGPARSTVLWVRISGREQFGRARKLPVLPSLALREGGSSRRLLLWWLREPLPYFDTQDANRKLAYACGATQKFGVPEALRVPLPGSCVRRGARPSPVVVTRLESGAWDWRAVVGRLKEPPDPNAWMENQRKGA